MAQTKLNLYDIILTKNSHISEIFLAKDYNIDFINSKNLIKKKILSKKIFDL